VNYVERHFGDWARDTAHLSMLEDGAYNRLCDLYYVRETPLPAELAACCRLVRAQARQERQAVQAVLQEFFVLTDEGWRHKRCDLEIERFRTKSGKAAASAKARWNKAAAHSEGNANADANASTDAMRTHSEGNATRERGRTRTHSPNTNTQNPTPETQARAVSPPPSRAPAREPPGFSDLPNPPPPPPDPPPEVGDHEPTAAGLACRAMRQAGLQGVNPGDPRLLALLAQGATVPELAGLAAEAVERSKGWAWVLATAQGRRADAAAISLAPAAAAAPAIDPTAWAKTRSGVVNRACELGIGPWDEVAGHVGSGPTWAQYRRKVIEAHEAAKGAR
jgi:uncharacterized protein YdaU (DUF1376 family)